MSNNEILNRIRDLFDTKGVEFRVLEHPPCHTSKESAAARSLAGAPEAVGAKAMLCRMEFSDRHVEHNVLVLPGPARLDSRALRVALPGLKRFRFVSIGEMNALCQLMPGAMPPFAKSVFPQLDHLYVDRSLLAHEMVGFNAGCHERSIVIRSHDYVGAASPTAVLEFVQV